MQTAITITTTITLWNNNNKYMIYFLEENEWRREGWKQILQTIWINKNKSSLSAMPECLFGVKM